MHSFGAQRRIQHGSERRYSQNPNISFKSSLPPQTDDLMPWCEVGALNTHAAPSANDFPTYSITPHDFSDSIFRPLLSKLIYSNSNDVSALTPGMQRYLACLDASGKRNDYLCRNVHSPFAQFSYPFSQYDNHNDVLLRSIRSIYGIPHGEMATPNNSLLINSTLREILKLLGCSPPQERNVWKSFLTTIFELSLGTIISWARRVKFEFLTKDTICAPMFAARDMAEWLYWNTSYDIHALLTLLVPIVTKSVKNDWTPDSILLAASMFVDSPEIRCLRKMMEVFGTPVCPYCILVSNSPNPYKKAFLIQRAVNSADSNVMSVSNFDVTMRKDHVFNHPHDVITTKFGHHLALTISSTMKVAVLVPDAAGQGLINQTIMLESFELAIFNICIQYLRRVFRLYFLQKRFVVPSDWYDSHPSMMVRNYFFKSRNQKVRMLALTVMAIQEMFKRGRLEIQHSWSMFLQHIDVQRDHAYLVRGLISTVRFSYITSAMILYGTTTGREFLRRQMDLGDFVIGSFFDEPLRLEGKVMAVDLTEKKELMTCLKLVEPYFSKLIVKPKAGSAENLDAARKNFRRYMNFINSIGATR